MGEGPKGGVEAAQLLDSLALWLEGSVQDGWEDRALQEQGLPPESFENHRSRN